MIESYLGQQNTILWKAFVNSCEDNLSPEVLMVTCKGGKYCTCSHVFGTHVLYAHAHNDQDAHVQNARTPTLHPHTYTHTNTDVMAFSCGPGSPHIGDTSDQKCQHFLDICSPAVWVYSIPRYLLIIPTCHSHTRHTNTHTNWIACATICQQEIAAYWTEQVIHIRACLN